MSHRHSGDSKPLSNTPLIVQQVFLSQTKAHHRDFGTPLQNFEEMQHGPCPASHNNSKTFIGLAHCDPDTAHCNCNVAHREIEESQHCVCPLSYDSSETACECPGNPTTMP